LLWNSTNAHSIGSQSSAGAVPFDGYLALVHFIDGQALTPSSFGETSATTGQWIAKTYSGSYGTNGFFLDFSDNSAATATTLGKDSSGNGNNWTPNNLSVTAGSGNDSLRDHPVSAGTDSGVGGEVSGNYSTFNPLQKNTNITLTNGNLDCSGSGVYSALTTIYFPSSGKYYAEFLINGTSSGYPAVGILAPNDAGLTAYANPSTGAVYFQGGYITRDGSTVVSSLTQLSANDIVRVAYDPSTRNVWFALNGGSWVGGGNPATGSTPSTTLNANDRGYCFGASVYTSAGVTINTGQRAWAYTAPSGFSPLVDTLLPTPTIAKPNTVMDVALWTGNGSARSITGLGFNPDLVWIKGRSGSTDHALRLYDSVRGAGNNKDLISASTGAEGAGADDQYGYISSFDSAGFSTTAGTADNDQWNSTNQTFAAWCWDAGSSNATNTSGTITSTVRANISAGFSVVTYTGTASNRTVGHGLGVAPSLIIVKNRSSAVNWRVYHSALGGNKAIFLNTTDAADTWADYWNNTAPTSTTFSIGPESGVNGSGNNMIAYCWTPVAGYSAFGSYTGNGSTDGPFVYTGFRPAVVLVKMSSSTGNWTILDDKREGYNVDNDPLYPNLSDAEGTTDLIDITSNGFKVRTTDATFNTSSGTYIYAAWASAPFPYSRAR